MAWRRYRLPERWLLPAQALLSVAVGNLCNKHTDCMADQYCFSRELCQHFMKHVGFHVGDRVILSTDLHGAQLQCNGWVVVGCNQDGTYNVQCFSGKDSRHAVPKSSLRYADNFKYSCGDTTNECGMLQLCPTFGDSIDGSCPGEAPCYDLNNEFCQRVKESPRLCAQPFHGPNVSTMCCAACRAFYRDPSPSQTHSVIAKSTDKSRLLDDNTTAAPLVAFALFIIVCGFVIACVLRKRRMSTISLNDDDTQLVVRKDLEESADSEYTEMVTPRHTSAPGDTPKC